MTEHRTLDCSPLSCVAPTSSDARILGYGSLRSHIVPREWQEPWLIISAFIIHNLLSCSPSSPDSSSPRSSSPISRVSNSSMSDRLPSMAELSSFHSHISSEISSPRSTGSKKHAKSYGQVLLPFSFSQSSLGSSDESLRMLSGRVNRPMTPYSDRPLVSFWRASSPISPENSRTLQYLWKYENIPAPNTSGCVRLAHR